MKEFIDYKGSIEYSLSGTRLVIPEVNYEKTIEKDNGDIIYSGTGYKGMILEVEIDGEHMRLMGASETTDNLGNITSRTNILVELTKTNLSNKDI